VDARRQYFICCCVSLISSAFARHLRQVPSWIQSTSFASYMLSRVIGGLSEGNVQLAKFVNVSFRLLRHVSKCIYSAIISDVTPTSQRSRALSSVGIAFAICFCIGPPIGAYFASKSVPSSFRAWGIELNIYAVPAILTLVLLLIETAYLFIALPETLNTRPSAEALLEKKGNRNGRTGRAVIQQDSSVRLRRLGAVYRIHFLFLVVFSGVEFTLTFLTFDCG
jgi:MFS family permease